MATRALFNHTNVQTEQNLLEDLVIESIQIYGLDMYYLPKTTADLDDFYGEDAGTTKYLNAYPIEMYVKNVEGFEGEGDFMQQFGLEVRDQMTLTVARKRFDELSTGLSTPNEGDLIWFPITKSVYQIQFVEHESIFYQMGELFVYDLTCELFEFAGEVFETGIPAIDSYALDVATGNTFSLSTGSGVFEDGETVYQGATLSGASMTARVKDFDELESTLEITNITTTPADGVAITGVDSGASWIIDLPNTESTEEAEMEDTNWTIEQEADEFIDFTEESPFGEF